MDASSSDIWTAGKTFSTHRVFNQPGLPHEYNALVSDRPVTAFLDRNGSSYDQLLKLGDLVTQPETLELARLANEHVPVLRAFDRTGSRIDEVEFHPAWHELMRMSMSRGIASYPSVDSTDKDAHLCRAIGLYLVSQAEAGHGCPLSMTYSSVPTLRQTPEVAEVWERGLRSNIYDFTLAAPTSKSGLTLGMAMTEKQGGSDVRMNTTTAERVSEGTFSLVGHKWFCSAPMSDGFMTLARTSKGLTCFLVPRVLEDGLRNEIHLMRLKDKVGNRSNASSEMEFTGALGYLVGEDGDGIRTILHMVGGCRLDSLIGSAAQMRQGLVQALWYSSLRTAFSSLLIEHPLMRNVLIDMVLESEASTLLALRMAHASDRAEVDPKEAAFRRIGIAVAKFLVCKRAPAFAAEAMECLGGSGYVEESLTARLFRESPLNGIWEGAGNVNALDTLRAISKDSACKETLLEELYKSSGFSAIFDRRLREVAAALEAVEIDQWSARSVVAGLGALLQCHLLHEYSSPISAELFIQSRLVDSWGPSIIGRLPKIDRASQDLILDSAVAGLL